MSVESHTEHAAVKDLRLPYRTFDSPAATDNMWQDGRNCYANSRGYLERRPGFGATLEPVPTTFSAIARIFTWSRWAGTPNAGFYVMVSDFVGGVAKVYSFQLGVDASARLIFTSNSSEPFDFIEANNHCYFGNGTEMRAYDGATVRNWGIVRPAAAPTVVYSAPTTANDVILTPTTLLNGWGAGGHVGDYGDYESGHDQGHSWTTSSDTTEPYVDPSKAFDADEATYAEGKWQHTHVYGGCVWTFAYASNTLSSPTLNVLSECVNLSGVHRSAGIWYSLDAGASWRQVYNEPIRAKQWDVITLPDSQDLNKIQVMAFADAHDDIDHRVYEIKIHGTITGLTHGYYYRATYGNSTIKHESSSSPLSSLTTGNAVGLVASTDPQVDEIHVYRTPLDGSTNPYKMQELPTSPYPNRTQSIQDTATDVDLQLSYCPTEYSNDPPPPSMGFVWAQQRIWAFSGNMLYYSGFEELIKGVPEESWPAGLDGNFRPYKRAIHALATMANGIDVLTAASHYGVDGDSLDTFRWGTLLERRGTRSRTGTISLGSSVIWSDTSTQIWSSGGTSGLQSSLGQYQWRSADRGELGLDIRPTLAAIPPLAAALTVHISGEMHWLVVQDAAHGLLYVYNLDTSQWQVPWTFHSTALHSGETADGQVDLLAAQNGTTLVKLTPDTFTDQATAYDAWIRTNLFMLAKGEQSAVVDYLEVERNAVPLTDVLQMVDDATGGAPGEAGADYTSIFENEHVPFQRGNGKFLVTNRYTTGDPLATNTGSSACMRASFELHWGASADKFELYTIDVAHHPAVSR